MSRNREPIKVGFPEEVDDLIREDAADRPCKPPQIIREIVTNHYRKQGKYTPNGNGNGGN